MAKKPLSIEALKHDAKRLNIPTAEFESLMRDEEKSPVQLAYERRNRDLDPQLVWRGKDEQDWSDLIVQAPPLYVQEKVHPKALIDDLKRQTKLRKAESDDAIPDLFADFNGLPDKEAVTEFYRHDLHWSNRMISGDSLSVMASLAEREGLRGQVQCIYFDPPYGIKFNSNFQWSTTLRDVKDGAKDHVTREPEQVRAFRDTWKDGIHSYLTYLRDRLTVARDLLSESGSIFVQIGDENVHRVRALMDEVFGDTNFIAQIQFQTAANQNTNRIQRLYDCVLWYKGSGTIKFRELLRERDRSEIDGVFTAVDELTGRRYKPSQIKSNDQVPAVWRSGRLTADGKYWKRYISDFPVVRYDTVWKGTVESTFSTEKIYVVQTNRNVVERCILMTTDPGDIVLDPTCGSGTSAYVSEQWGRRWITIDTSRVAIALARARLMGSKYPYYILADSPDGQKLRAQAGQAPLQAGATFGSIRAGFVYERVTHITLKSIVDNAHIEEIRARTEPAIRAAVESLNTSLRDQNVPFKIDVGKRKGQLLDYRAANSIVLPSGENAKASGLLDWEIPREVPVAWPATAREALKRFWDLRAAQQEEIDASIAAKAEFEYLYDKPYTDKAKVRVAGPFTVESLSPHTMMVVGPDDELVPMTTGMAENGPPFDGADDFPSMILKNLRVAGVQQAHKEDRIAFTSLVGWPGDLICAEGRYLEGEVEKRAGIFIGPEFGTVSRPDLVAAAREAGDAGFDVLVACAFNYDAHSAEFSKLGRVPVLRARMNPDLHMAGDLAATGAGNLFVIFGEPDIKIEDAGRDTDGAEQVQVKVSGVDVFKPQTGEVVSEDTDGIALWMLDTDYNEESFFVRHAYFLGANDPYKALKTTLKAEIDEEAWSSLNSDTSRPFPKPSTGRIAVKVINHLGDEVMKVFEVR